MNPGTGPTPIILPMCRADLDTVTRVATDAFGFAFPRAQLVAELDNQWSVARVLRPESGHPPCAFLVYWVTADEAQLIHVATAPEAQSSGYAQALLRDAFTGALQRGCRAMTLEVRVSNAVALGLYERLGFERLGLRPGYYSDTREDAVVMRCRLPVEPP